ncbi:MAG: leucine--tRNA ligase [Candidatus Thorarchaeota archaeon]
MTTFLDEIREIERKWQKKWQGDQIFVGNVDNSRPKWFLTVSYPYVQAPFHIGHSRTYGLGDIFARYKRQRGYNVLWPMGFHITGTPVLAVSWKIKNNDEKEWDKYRDYVSIYEDDKERIEELVASFTEPENVASYFSEKIINDFLRMGYSLDTTRQFTTGDKDYNKFIEWQYFKLNDKNLITKGNHPILWCVNDKNAVGEDDIQSGDELKVEVSEFVGIKFKLDSGIFLVAATLRPETIYGATNVWIHPETSYNEITIDGEKWIVSKEATLKLMEQNHKIEITRELEGKELLEKNVEVPLTKAKIPIYPATFVDTDHATGIVYSVPGHAPYDYAALVDLQKDEETIEIYKLDSEQLKEINPISLIEVKGYGEFPAVEICQKMAIKSQKEIEKLEEATQIIYKDEYYSGIMKENTGEFEGLRVEEAKDRVADTLFKINLAAPIYEPSTKAFCRCGGQIIVAIIQNQYFLNYGDKKWKEKAFKALNKMLIIPEKYRLSFENTFHWLNQRPCVRRRGLGTEFPFTKGEGWIIESLSDSVIYMSFYTIVRHIRNNNLQSSQLKPELFDYVFLSEGDIKEVSKSTTISEEIISQMKEEFEYWYPNDLRHTGIHHISNHLSFAIFHHVAIFPEKYWLPAFSINEMLISEGESMSKSRGNVIPIAHIPDRYSVDLTRLHLASVATADTVLDWKEAEVSFAQQRMKKFWDYALSVMNVKKINESDYSFPSKVFLSSVKTNLEAALKSIEKFNVRDYILDGYYANIREIDSYQKLAEHLPEAERKSVLREVIELMVVFIAPAIPHICEELYERMGYSDYVSLTLIPEIEISDKDKNYALQAKYIANLMEDIEQIVKLVKKHPKKIHIYINAEWKNNLYELANNLFKEEAVQIDKIMKAAKTTKELSNYMKEVANEAKMMLKDPTIFRIKMLRTDDQRKAIEGYAEFISKKYGDSEIIIHLADDTEIYDPQNKSQKARPMKPALLLE